MADYKITPTGIEGVISEDAYNTYQASLDDIRSGVAQTDQEVIDQAVNGVSTNGSGFATSTNLGTDYLSSLMNSGVILDTEKKAELARITAQRKSGIASMLDAGRSRIDSQFRRLIQEATEIGKNEVGYARAMMARSSGGDLGADTASMGAIQTVQQGAEKRLDELRSRREEAMSKLDFEMASKMDAIYNDEAEELSKFYEDAWKKKLDIIGLATDQEKMDLTKLQMDWDYVSKLKEGKIWVSPITGRTYTGTTDDELSTADWISIAKNIPIGTSEPIEINGKTYNISGLGKSDVNTQIFQATANGRKKLVIVDKDKALDPAYQPKIIDLGASTTKGDGSLLTSTDEQKLATQGVPTDVSNFIMSKLEEGWEYEPIRQELYKDYPEEQAKRYMDTTIQYLQSKTIDEGEIPQNVMDIMSNPDASIEDLMNAYNSLD